MSFLRFSPEFRKTHPTFCCPKLKFLCNSLALPISNKEIENNIHHFATLSPVLQRALHLSNPWEVPALLPSSRRGRGWQARTRLCCALYIMTINKKYKHNKKKRRSTCPTCQSSGCVAWTTSRDDFPLRAVSSPQGGPTQRTSSQGRR